MPASKSGVSRVSTCYRSGKSLKERLTTDFWTFMCVNQTFFRAQGTGCPP